MGLIGGLSGKTVVDLACGEGFYTRLIRQQGAAKVVGVDLSARMVELAREQEAEQRLGIEYVTGDARHLEPKGEVTHGRDFWKCFMDHPPIIGIECFKQGPRRSQSEHKHHQGGVFDGRGFFTRRFSQSS